MRAYMDISLTGGYKFAAVAMVLPPEIAGCQRMVGYVNVSLMCVRLDTARALCLLLANL